MSRREFTALTALTAAAPALAACGSSGRNSADALEVWVYNDASTTVQEEFADRFNEESDIQINLTLVSSDDYVERVRTAMGGDSPPDMFFNWGGGSISDYVDKGKLRDLSSIIEDTPTLRDGFVPSILDAGAVDGRYYGIPMRGVQPVILYYNKTLFNEAGIETPTTLDDLFDVVRAFQREDITPAVLAGADDWTDMMWLEYLLDRQGGSAVFQRIQSGDMSGWGDPAVLTAAEYVADLVDAGAFGGTFESVSYTNDAASTVFAQGKGAMHLMGSWEYANQLANQPDFAKHDLAYATFPTIDGGEGDPSAIVGNPTNYWSVHADVTGDRLDAAVEFLKMMASEDYAQALVDNGDVPTTTNAAELLDSAPNPTFATWQYDLVENASNFQLSWDQALPASQATPMLEGIQKLFGGQLRPREFVDEMKDL